MVQTTPTEQPTLLYRRHDIDWLRTIAIGLLIVYHSAIAFQPQEVNYAFPRNEKPLEILWIVMNAVIVWRIPILFLISGMGVRFAMVRRDWKALLKDRSVRILLPYLFGSVAVTPFLTLFNAVFYDYPFVYTIRSVHLWFLLNIFLYILLLILPMNWLKNNPDNRFICTMKRWFSKPFTLYLFTIPVVLETFFSNPRDFTRYYHSMHGFFLGLICFFTGFLMISLEEVFWRSVKKIFTSSLVVAFCLYCFRVVVSIIQEKTIPQVLIGFESMVWILGLIGLGSMVLNKPSRTLTYLSQAAYPVYIIHLPVQFGLSNLILPLAQPASLKYMMLVIGTLGVSLGIYELVLRRINLIRPLFGMKRITHIKRAATQ